MILPKILLALLAMALTLTVDPRLTESGWRLIAMAAADDDDDDDDAPRRRPRAPAGPRPDRAPDEIIAHDLSPAELAQLEAEGFREIRRLELGSGASLHRLRKPKALSLNAAQRRVRALDESADFNHYYRAEQSGDCGTAACQLQPMIHWPKTSSACGTPPRIGMVDTGINPDLAVFASADLRLHRLDRKHRNSSKSHGTAVAALLVGSADSPTAGLIPEAELIAVDIFTQTKNDERADVFALIEALDFLAKSKVDLVNLSLSGPENNALGAQVRQMSGAGISLIAAAGNGGPKAAPAYPAAYPEVIAVTAVDRRGQIYRRAGRGAHIDLAAPGVDLWTAASIRGGRAQSGTSFAAPVVTAAAALLLQAEPGLTPETLRRRLADGALDLGQSGRDEVFGEGLVTPHDPCLPALE